MAPDSFARQGTKMGDTITLNTTILLATRDFRDGALVHGGSNKAERTQKSGNERNIAGVLSHSCQDQMNIYARPRKLSLGTREAIVHP